VTAPTAISSLVARERRAIRVRGRVQGVGFRPAMVRLAGGLGLDGLVYNDSEGVWIEVEGNAAAVARFQLDLRTAAPAVARIETVETITLPPLGTSGFHIARSPATSAAVEAEIPPDAAPCEACLRELGDPADRRHAYPFINCTACGPRFTIVRELPYDRSGTTMADFPLCPACAREYADPGDRRFHAEPNACPTCGPRLCYLQAGAKPHAGTEALADAIAALAAGQIVAVKGAGGFVLAADATATSTILELRRRKQRPDKPLAVMGRDLETLETVALLGPAARGALSSPARPIVLVPARPHGPLSPAVAPGLAEVGVFLPPTPLQHLLLSQGPALQVMTSGNRRDEPIAKDDADAVVRLAGLADGVLLHDRAIHTRADDSVVRVIAGVARPLRRARGYVPEPIALPVSGPAVLAVGGQLAGTVCLARGGRAVLSPHLGDLSDPEAFAFFEESVEKLADLLGARPVAVACDQHPDYRSTRWAQARGLLCLPVQHHHAHVAACLAEHGHTGPALGVAFDGTGHGPGGALWGGELLEADLGGFLRRGHLRPLALPGGEAAIRAPWRLALAALVDAGEPLDLIAHERRDAVEALVRSGRCPLATGAGRWFDAVAALCGLTPEISYEGQAPRALEALVTGEVCAPYPFAIEESAGAPFSIDLRPTVRAIAADRRAGRDIRVIATAFHETMAFIVRAACQRARQQGGPALVALAGGCFANRWLAERSIALLEEDGFTTLLPRRVPPGDGGLAYGQAAVASFRLLASQEGKSCA
jgi:hydrogenase maturation protein HypF